MILRYLGWLSSQRVYDIFKFPQDSNVSILYYIAIVTVLISEAITMAIKRESFYN